MANSSSLSHLLHSNSAATTQSQPQPQQPQPQPQHQQQQQQQQHQPPPPPPPPPPSRQHSRAAAAANASSTLTPITATGYDYHGPPSSLSPAASATSNSLATPATSPTVTSAPASANGSTVPRGHAANTSLYQCADCLKRYSRPEHLQRHISTHTLGKRFVCDVCGKAFGRADLLKRHRTNHDDDGNGTKRRRINSSPGAGRVAHACQACAKARVKCEELKPCTRCRTRNVPCEYASSEAGSAAAMHLLHLSANAHSTNNTPPAVSPSAGMRPTSRNLPGSDVLSSQMGQPHPRQGLPTHAANAMTNPPYSRSNGSSPSVLPGNHPPGSHEAAQLPTPETLIEHNHPNGYHAQYSQGHGMVGLSSQHFGDFLQNVLYDQEQQQQQQQEQQQQQIDPSRMAVAQGLAVLDFCDDANLDMNDIDFGMLDNWNLGNIHGMIATDPNLANYVSNQSEDSADMSNMRQRLVSIWADSPWRWVPDGTKDNIHTLKSNLPLGDINGSQLRPDKVVNDVLEPSGRDKILAIVLGTCQNNVMLGRVASSFPSTDVMDSLVHIFLAWHLCQVSEFVHFGSFRVNDQCPEWLAVAAAAGATLTPVRALRKFGFALQEAVRVTIPNRFEDNNSKIQDASLVQALVLGHDIGLWSGNRRRMEIAECHLNIPIAMTRGRGTFQKSAYPPLRVDPSDEGAVLEHKWKIWYQRESWKRLIFHLYVRDAQASMTSMSNPHMSYAELTLPLPEARELWFAKTAQEWKVHYLERHPGPDDRLPSLVDLLRDVHLLTTEQRKLDFQYAVTIFLHGVWSLVREYRQMDAIYRGSPFSSTTASNPNVLLQSRHQELVKMLEQFQDNAAHSWPQVLSAQENVVLNLLLMNLHVSLEDLQLFSGKEGDEQARRILPSLQSWVREAASRRAIWHAGQILRWAKEFPTGHLKDFYAVAVHHAALALWTWGVVTRALQRSAGLPHGFNPGEPVVYLDAHGVGLAAQLLSYSTGRPAIRGPVKRASGGAREGAAGSSSGGVNEGAMSESLVEEPTACMGVVEEIFCANFLEGHVAPIVENLCHLIKQLGKAAGAVGLG